MYIITVTTAEDGTICASEPAPAEAICTITTPDGCEVYMPEDEEQLLARLSAVDDK